MVVSFITLIVSDLVRNNLAVIELLLEAAGRLAWVRTQPVNVNR